LKMCLSEKFMLNLSTRTVIYFYICIT